MTYPVANFLIQIKNAYMANKNEMSFPYSKMVLSIGKVLKDEGYVKDIKEGKDEGHPIVVVTLLYRKNEAALKDVKIISKPSVHTYVNKTKAYKAATKYDVAIVSTNQGIMSNRKATKLGIGGELLARVS
ncbi:MAG TPA: 30S ribosomal protein S8 [Ignavibacteriaceae bacterium]